MEGLLPRHVDATVRTETLNSRVESLCVEHDTYISRSPKTHWRHRSWRPGTPVSSPSCGPIEPCQSRTAAGRAISGPQSLWTSRK